MMRAERVAGPKYVDSLPGDPGPVVDTMNPLELSNTCRALTSDPVLPTARLRVNAVDVGTVVFFGTVGVAVLGVSDLVYALLYELRAIWVRGP